MRHRDAQALLAALPYPLELTAGMYLRRKELREEAPELARLSDEERERRAPDVELPAWAWGFREAISTVLKVVSLIALADHLRLAAEADKHDREAEADEEAAKARRKLNARIVDLLSGAPPERGWLTLLRNLLAHLDQEAGSIFPRDWLTQPTAADSSLRTTMNRLVDFRDQVAHGNFAWEEAGPLEAGEWTIGEPGALESIGPDEIAAAELRLDAVYSALEWLTHWELWASRSEEGRPVVWHHGRGPELQPGEAPPAAAELAGKCALVQGDTVVSLHPWALLKPGARGETVEFSELPVFDKLAATSPEFLAYAEGVLYRRDPAPPTYDDMRRLMQELEAASGREQPDSFAWSELVEAPPAFEGRRDVIDAVTRFAEQGEGYGVVLAVAGQGKTALFRHLYDQTQEAGEGPLWVWHFCARGEGRDNGYRFLRSVLAQLSDAYRIDGFPRSKWEREPLESLRDNLRDLLGEAAEAAGRRLVLVVDAIDEAATGGGYGIPDLLPLQLPDTVVVILSERCAADGTPDLDLARFGLRPADVLAEAGVLSPMAGLAPDEVGALLDEAAAAAEKPAVSEAVAEKVYRASDEGNALFVRFITDDIRAGQIDPANPAEVPDSLDDYFDVVWDGLSDEHRLLAHRLLLRLAIARDPVSDALLADLLGEAPERVEAGRARLGKWLSVREQEGEPRYRIFHNRFVDFVLDVVRPSEVQGLHRDVVSYGRKRWLRERNREDFSPERLARSEALLYALAHLPEHEVEAELWDEAYETLTDFRFLEAKAMHVARTTLPDGTEQYGGVYALQEDYRRVLAAMP